MGQDANALPSLPISITVASLSAIELRQTHAGKRLSFWQEPLNGIGAKPQQPGPPVQHPGAVRRGRAAP